MPSIFIRSLYLLISDNSLNPEKVRKYFDKILAFSNPMCLMPNE